MLKEFLTDKNYKLFEFKELQNYINELSKFDIKILSQQENKETKTKKITIQIREYTITFVLQQVVPKLETLQVKVYNEDNVNIEQITFSYDEIYQMESNCNYYIDIYKLVETNWMLQIIRQSNCYSNNILIKQKNSYIKTSKEEIKEYFNNRINTLSKDVETYYYNICNYDDDQVYEITKRNTDLQQISKYLTKEKGRENRITRKKSKKLNLTNLKNLSN